MEKEGYGADVCKDGLKTFKILSQIKYHVVVTYLKMPKMDENIQVIMISGHVDVDVVIETMKKGAYDFIC